MTRAIDTVDLAGDPHTRGAAFGAVRRQQLQACMVDWLKSVWIDGIADPKTYLDALLRDTNFLPAIREHTPDLLDEVRGIAFGADQPFALVLASQFMDEEWAFRSSFQRRADVFQKCSSVAIRSHKGPTWIGQNMDLGGYTDGHQLLLRIAPHAAEAGTMVFTIGGMIGLMGVNARGVGVCVNSLPQLPSAREGLPVAFAIRKLLQADSVADAVQVVCALPHATGQHYLLADPASIRSFEASPGGVVEYHAPNPSRVLHTNHPLAAGQGKAYPAPEQANTIARLNALTNRLMTGEPDLDAIMGALSSSDNPDHPVCRVPSANATVSAGTRGSFTTGSMISALQRGAPGVDSWVSAGPPSVRGYTHVSLVDGGGKPVAPAASN